MMPADETNKVSKSNVGQDPDSVQSMSMVIIQLFADCKRTIEC